MICTDPTCRVPRSQVTRQYVPFRIWAGMPNTVVEHCECGQHNRVWSQGALLRVWRERRIA